MNNVDSFTELVFACHVCLFLFANMFLIVFVYFYSQVLDFFCGKCGAQKHYGVLFLSWVLKYMSDSECIMLFVCVVWGIFVPCKACMYM